MPLSITDPGPLLFRPGIRGDMEGRILSGVIAKRVTVDTVAVFIIFSRD
jgi:hypothetical protein